MFRQNSKALIDFVNQSFQKRGQLLDRIFERISRGLRAAIACQALVHCGDEIFPSLGHGGQRHELQIDVISERERGRSEKMIRERERECETM